MARDVAKLAEDVADRCLDPSNDFHRAGAAFLARASQALNSTAVLACYGFVADAMSVARTVFELDIDLAYIAKDDTVSRLAAFVAYETVSKHKLASAIARLLDIGDDEALARIEARSKSTKAIIKAKPKDSDAGNWAGVDIASRAKRADRVKTYELAYVEACGTSHSGMTTLRYATEFDDDGDYVLRWGPGKPLPHPIQFACMSLISMIDALLIEGKDADMHERVAALIARLTNEGEPISG